MTMIGTLEHGWVHHFKYSLSWLTCMEQNSTMFVFFLFYTIIPMQESEATVIHRDGLNPAAQQKRSFLGKKNKSVKRDGVGSWIRRQFNNVASDVKSDIPEVQGEYSLTDYELESVGELR